ncbi:MAG: hypothetical protein LBK06_01970 [Planctomycetaceae bacterium]|nr:hypothetical protein [Planctomycetaceae bacterium]
MFTTRLNRYQKTIYAEAVLKFAKLNTAAQQREAIVQGRSLLPYRLRYILVVEPVGNILAYFIDMIREIRIGNSSVQIFAVKENFYRIVGNKFLRNVVQQRSALLVNFMIHANLIKKRHMTRTLTQKTKKTHLVILTVDGYFLVTFTLLNSIFVRDTRDKRDFRDMMNN